MQFHFFHFFYDYEQKIYEKGYAQMVTSKTGYAEIKGRAMPTIFEMGNAQKTLSKTGNSLQREGDAQNISLKWSNLKKPLV